jgi:hypothetical protein
MPGKYPHVTNKANPRSSWANLTPPPEPAPPVKKPKGKVPIITGVIFGCAMVALFLWYQFRSSNDKLLATDKTVKSVNLENGSSAPMDVYASAHQLYKLGKYVEAMTLVQKGLQSSTNSQERKLFSTLAEDIEIAPRLKVITDLIKSGSQQAALLQLEQLRSENPQNEQINTLKATLEILPQKAGGPVSTAKKTEQRKGGGGRPPRHLPPSHKGAAIAEEESRASASANVGWVSIKSDEKSYIFVDGKDTGKTTPDKAELPPGQHQIELRSTSDGLARREQSVKITAGQTTEVNIKLHAKPRRVINNNPYNQSR